MTSRLIVAVQGYGAPEQPETDGNLDRYLTEVLRFCNDHAEARIELHLMGGYTNSPTVTEAEAMERWIDARDRPENVWLILKHTMTTDLRGNIESLAGTVTQQDRVIYFCEASRLPATQFLARRHLQHLRTPVTVIGVPFDQNSLRLKHRLLQLGPKLWLEVTADVLGGPFEALRFWLREQHIRRHRKLAKE